MGALREQDETSRYLMGRLRWFPTDGLAAALGHEVWILDNLCIAKLEGIQLGIDLGELTKPRAVALAGKLEEMCYNRARCTMVVAGDIRRRLE